MLLIPDGKMFCDEVALTYILVCGGVLCPMYIIMFCAVIVGCLTLY